MRLHWHYTKTIPFMPQGKDTTRKNFAQEERSDVGILIREALQNALDAKADENDGAVRVEMRSLEPKKFDADYLGSIVTPEFRERARTAGGPNLPAANACSVLVIEDFGTKGLLGNVEDYNADGPEQNWNAFWHREGEGAKGRASNGGAGQGKITYLAHSRASMFLGVTVRVDDKKRLMMGRASFLRDYKYKDDAKYYRTSYWTVSDDLPTPETDDNEIAKFMSAFSIARDTNNPGLSVVIPFSKGFDEHEAIVSVILDFYIPIASKKLEVKINELVLNANTIDDEAARIQDSEVLKRGSAFTSGYRSFVRDLLSQAQQRTLLAADWNKDRAIPEAAFPPGELNFLRAKLSNGERLAFELPLTLKPRDGDEKTGTFEIYMELPSELQENEESFVRQDLLIGGESHLSAGAFVQKARSITWIRNQDLSDFLLAAENPSHLKWNASLAREVGEYKAPDKILQSIRQAVPRLLSILLAGSESKDTKSLARFFSRPSSDSKRGGPGKVTKTAGQVGPKPMPIIDPKPPKLFRMEFSANKVTVLLNAKSEARTPEFPINATIEFAYEGLDQDPFKGYDPFDFNIADQNEFSLNHQDAQVTLRDKNRIEFQALGPNFMLKISGFDPNMRLRSRLSYTSTQEAQDIVPEESDA